MNIPSLYTNLCVSHVFFLIQLKSEPEDLILPETNIAPTNGWLEYYFPIGMAYVSFTEGILLVFQESFSIKKFQSRWVRAWLLENSLNSLGCRALLEDILEQDGINLQD